MLVTLRSVGIKSETRLQLTCWC